MCFRGGAAAASLSSDNNKSNKHFVAQLINIQFFFRSFFAQFLVSLHKQRETKLLKI